MGWFSDFFSDPIGTTFNTVTENIVPAVIATAQVATGDVLGASATIGKTIVKNDYSARNDNQPVVQPAKSGAAIMSQPVVTVQPPILPSVESAPMRLVQPTQTMPEITVTAKPDYTPLLLAGIFIIFYVKG